MTQHKHVTICFFSEEEFHTIQNGFLDKYYKEFDDTEENKFIYSDVHTEYVSYFENKLLCILNIYYIPVKLSTK